MTFADFTTSGLRLGYTGTLPSLNYLGDLDEVAYFPRVVTPTEIANLASAAPAPALPAYAIATGDPTGSGVSNLMDYYLGGQPGTGVPPSAPSISAVTVGGANYLALTYQPNVNSTDVTAAVQVSGDLSQWNSGASFTTVVSDTTTGGVRQVTVRDNVAISAAVRRFIRLSVSLP